MVWILIKLMTPCWIIAVINLFILLIIIFLHYHVTRFVVPSQLTKEQQKTYRAEMGKLQKERFRATQKNTPKQHTDKKVSKRYDPSTADGESKVRPPVKLKTGPIELTPNDADIITDQELIQQIQDAAIELESFTCDIPDIEDIDIPD